MMEQLCFAKKNGALKRLVLSQLDFFLRRINLKFLLYISFLFEFQSVIWMFSQLFWLFIDLCINICVSRSWQ